jgi:hypothetical protein
MSCWSLRQNKVCRRFIGFNRRLFSSLRNPAETFAAGEQAKVPLLVGWNSAEIPLPGGDVRELPPTPENYMPSS